MAGLLQRLREPRSGNGRPAPRQGLVTTRCIAIAGDTDIALRSIGNPSLRQQESAMKRRSLHHILSACAFGMLAVPLLAAAEPGDMMHVTVTMKMAMQGGPGAMPARTNTVEVCTSKQHDPRDLVKNSGRQKDCAITAFKQAGSTTTFHEVCTGQMQMSGDASFTAHQGGVDGSMHFTGDAGGRAMTMDMSYAATRTGDCDYTPRAAH